MPFNLMEVIKNHFDGDFVSNASSLLGENAPAISKAITAIIPAGLAAILNKATSGEDGAVSVFDKAKEASANFSTIPALASSENNTQSNNDTASLLGNNQSTIISAISGFSGIKDSSVSSLTNSVLPGILGILGKYAGENGLSASGLSGFLASQKDHIIQSVPSDLSSMAGTLGFDPKEFSVVYKHIPGFANTPSYASDEQKSKNNWVVPLIFIIIVLGALFYFSRSCNETKPGTAAGDENAMIITPYRFVSQSYPLATVV